MNKIAFKSLARPIRRLAAVVSGSSLTPCFSWVWKRGASENRFNGLPLPVETVETVPTSFGIIVTQLKQGVNERSLGLWSRVCEQRGVVVLASLLLGAVAASADEDATNRLNRVTVSARFGYHISARFSGVAVSQQPLGPRTTPRGDLYNYDDGYVRRDISGNANGQTWYWGYDNSASQVAGNTILLDRSTVTGSAAGQSADSDPSYGAEIVYRRELGHKGRLRYGLEGAANYQNLSISSTSVGLGNVNRVTDAYPYTSGTTPPTATTAAPYQGSYQGPGFVIGDTAISSTSTFVAGGATIMANRLLDADIWGFRLGPYLEVPLCTNLDLSLSAGLAVGLLNPSVSWTETVSVTGGGTGSLSGGGDDFKVLYGGYVAASVALQLNERLSLVGGVQYQALGDYHHSFGGQNVEIDLRHSLFITLGLGYSF